MAPDNFSLLNKDFDVSKISKVERRDEDDVWKFETYFDSNGNKLLYREEETIPDYDYNYVKEEYYDLAGRCIRSFMIDVLEEDEATLVISDYSPEDGFGSSNTRTFDMEGNLLQVDELSPRQSISTYYTGKGIDYKVETDYDENQNLIEKRMYDGNGNLTERQNPTQLPKS